MFFFLLINDKERVKQIENDLLIGTTKSKIHYVQFAHAERTSYDFVNLYLALQTKQLSYADSLHPSKFAVASSNFDANNALLFRMKYSDLIQFWLEATGKDFVTEEQAALLYQIKKREAFSSLNSSTRTEELRELRNKLQLTISRQLS